MRTRHDIFHITAVISIVVMLTISPIMIGKAYSVEYTGQVSNTGNNVQSEYFTASLYRYEPPDDAEVEKGNEVQYDAETKEYFKPATSPFSNGSFPYTTETGDTTRYKINNAETELTDRKTYLLINDSNIDESTYYTATCNVEYNPPLGESNSISGNETLTLGNDTKQLKVGTAYKVSLYLFNVNYSGESDPKDMTISISITVSKYSKNYSGIYSSPTESITIETELDHWADKLRDENPSLEKEGIIFVADDGNGDGPAGIFIQNSESENHSIAGDNGQIDVVMNVPWTPNKSFYLYITIDRIFDTPCNS